MALVFSAAMPQSLSRPSRIAELWARLTRGETVKRTPGADDRLLFELERLAEVSPHLLHDLGFAEVATGVFERRVWSLGDVSVAIDADGTATACVGDPRPAS